MPLKSFDELRKIDLTEHIKKREEIAYLPWAKCVDLLHENGADKVYFVPLQNEDGSSLFMSSETFKDSKGNTNRCYETHVEVHIDDETFVTVNPVMNGANPVKDNSMSQQRVWNSICRSFVKGVAIHTGLGFSLWAGDEDPGESDFSDKLAYHDIIKVRDRVWEKVTRILKEKNITTAELAQKLDRSEEEFRGCMGYYTILNELEKKIDKL